MRFQNFINRFKKPDEDYPDIIAGEMLDNQDEIKAQYDTIGLPSDTELSSSPNKTRVEEFMDDNDIYNKPYWQSDIFAPAQNVVKQERPTNLLPIQNTTPIEMPYLDIAKKSENPISQMGALVQETLLGNDVIRNGFNDEQISALKNMIYPDGSINQQAISIFDPMKSIHARIDGIDGSDNMKGFIKELLPKPTIEQSINKFNEIRGKFNDWKNGVMAGGAGSMPINEPLMNTNDVPQKLPEPVYAEDNTPVLKGEVKIDDHGTEWEKLFDLNNKDGFKRSSTPIKQGLEDKNKELNPKDLFEALDDKNMWKFDNKNLIFNTTVKKDGYVASDLGHARLEKAVNAALNHSNPDARALYNIAYDKVNAYDNNSQFKRLSDTASDYFSKIFNIDIPKDKQGMMFSPNSEYSKRIANSESLKNAIKENYDPKTGKFKQESFVVDFKGDSNLSRALGHATFIPLDVDKQGNVRGYIYDYYDFDRVPDNINDLSKEGLIKKANNYSYAQQNNGRIENYYYFVPVKMKMPK